MTLNRAASFAAVLAVAMTLMCAPATRAGIVAWDGDASILLSAPLSVAQGQLESNDNFFVFAEQLGVTLANPVSVDITAPGTYPSPDALTPGTIAAGTVVNSYYLHVDPIGQPTPIPVSYTGWVEFDVPILGVIVQGNKLDASDFLGAAGTTYVKSTTEATRGLELSGPYVDIVTLDNGRTRLYVDLSYVTTSIDQVRVITAVPEPVFFQMGALAGMSGLGLLRLRRRSR